MKKTVTNDIIFFTGEKDRKIDFSGDDSLCFEERIEYLNTYADYAAKWYNDANFDQKAASEEEVQTLCKKIVPIKTDIRKTVYLDKLNASKKRTDNVYKNLTLYAGASVVDNELVFAHKKRPGSAAKIDIISPRKKTTLSFDIFIPSEYKSSTFPEGHTGEKISGRIVELRCGTLYTVKLKFYCTGAIEISKYNELDPTHTIWQPQFEILDILKFGEYNHIEIEYDERAKITVNGKTAEGIRGISNGIVDNIFFEGGMIVSSYWKIKNIKINDNEFLYEKDLTKNSTEPIGIVSLPYAIGTIKNADCELHLSGSFEYKPSKKVYLTTDTLDPSGRVYVNGTLVLDTDSFERNRIDITSFVNDGTNSVDIIVMPRAPEVYYYWHRHTDCYNGWWCGEVKVEFTDNTYIEAATIITDSVENGVHGKIRVELNNSFNGFLDFNLKKIHPDEGDSAYIGSCNISGSAAEFEFNGNFDLWSDDDPNLYLVHIILKDNNGTPIDDLVEETGFRTICQKNGAIYLNGRRTILRGALMMQFMPPYDETPVNHHCPSNEQIAFQTLALKAMNGNFMRIHILGCGTNEARYARIFDRAGIMALWITRYIDTIEELADSEIWHEKEDFIKQAKAVINYPSIVMWEGSNEFHGSLKIIDKVYDEFVDTVKSFDTTRLICPLSHLHSLWDPITDYYDDDGLINRTGEQVHSGHGWVDPLVVRSSHPYAFFCGYGSPWSKMRQQTETDEEVPQLLYNKSNRFSYLATEYATTSLPNPDTKEFSAHPNQFSYEAYAWQYIIGHALDWSDWRVSQAYSALCAFNATKLMRLLDFDGMTWCCLMSGANDGTYMKPPVDFDGYKKISFYALKSAFEKLFVAKEDLKVCYGTEDKITPVILNSGLDGVICVTAEILDKSDTVIFKKVYDNVAVEEEAYKKTLEPLTPEFAGKGYYTIRFTVEKI